MSETGKRQRPNGGEWMRLAPAARELGVPRSTLNYRIMRGDFKTKMVSGVRLILIPATKDEIAA